MLRRTRTMAAGAVIMAGVVVVISVLAAGCGHPAPTRDERWRQDIAYLARELPRVHVGGLLGVPRPAWDEAAARLEAQVPRLTDGQVIAGMARMVAMVHDDETLLLLPGGAVFPIKLTWAGADLWLAAVPAGQRDLLGAQVLGVGGHPIAQVLSAIGSLIDYQDPGLLHDEEAGYLAAFPPLLHWLGLTPASNWAAFTVREADGVHKVVRIPAVQHVRAGSLAGLPQPLYLREQDRPYWLLILAAQHAVYLRYSQCLAGRGFQQLAAQALAVLRERPAYRLIVDLRDNPGGDTAPFASLIDGLKADPALHRRGTVFGLVNQETDSSATLDASFLAQVPNAVLIGQQPGDPRDEYGDESTFTLPNSRLTVVYTTAVVNDPRHWLAAPGIAVSPTIRQLRAGIDPVLAAALSYGRPSPPRGTVARPSLSRASRAEALRAHRTA